LSSAINYTKQVLSSVLKLNFKVPEENDLEKESLDLYLSNVSTLPAFSEKLGALSDIYIEIASLHNISENDYPITIEHLENGSLWIKVAGHSLTAIFLTAILTTATKYYQDEYTKTGELKQLSASVKVVDKLLDITNKLEKDGIDTSKIKENIESSTKKISKKLDILLGDQPFVEINDKELRISDAIHANFLEHAKVLKLENKGS
jgi:hypothetical protein